MERYAPILHQGLFFFHFPATQNICSFPLQTETFNSGNETVNPLSMELLDLSQQLVSKLSCQPTISSPERNLRLTRNMGCALNPDGNSGSVKDTPSWSKTGRTGPSACFRSIRSRSMQERHHPHIYLVHKILFDTSNTKAIVYKLPLGILCFERNDHLRRAYRSPQLLLLSGIGSASTLAQRGIPLVLDLPDVGKNLHDHMAYLVLEIERAGKRDGCKSRGKLSAPQFYFGLPAIGLPLNIFRGSHHCEVRGR